MRGAPLRIRPPGNGSRLERTGGGAGLTLQDYIDGVAKLVPGVVVSAYLTGKALLLSDASRGVGYWTGWTGICLFAVFATRVWATSDGEKVPTEWSSVIVASLAFVVWIYSFGDVFVMIGVWDRILSGLLVITWTLLAPILQNMLKSFFGE